MDSDEISNNKRDELNHIITNDILKNLKSDYFLKKIFNYLQKNKSLTIIKYCKNIQQKLNITINEYKNYSEICNYNIRNNSY